LGLDAAARATSSRARRLPPAGRARHEDGNATAEEREVIVAGTLGFGLAKRLGKWGNLSFELDVPECELLRAQRSTGSSEVGVDG